MDPADGMDYCSQPLSNNIGPMNEFGFGVQDALHASNRQGLDDLGDIDGLDWGLLPSDTFTQPQLFDEYQGFVTPQPYQDRFAQSLPTLPERRLYELEGFSPLSTQTSNETLTTSDQQPRRRSIRKRRIENGYHCNEPFCQEAFDTAGELTKHCYRKHTPEAAWPFACPACGKRFYDKRDYRRHENVERKRASAVGSTMRSVSASPKQMGILVEEKCKNNNIATVSSRTQSQISAEPEHRREDNSNTKKNLEFTGTNDQHISSVDLLEAAAFDLKRFVNLGAWEIMIKATMSSHGEPINISSSHTLKSKAHGTETSKSAKPLATASPPQPETSKPDRTGRVEARRASRDRQEDALLPISALKA
ncbi:hypothetical protein PRZ48_009886 [Zasmidium cellare]|uniref:C2H2-type domain-containing protein n=1 Tax=Zasmidium cellare TaxID=395010 RepID=A0ABR0EE77_ZASCE|nr:hypothetical protein PRZ48_009886 [Zasmidium cellare]